MTNQKRGVEGGSSAEEGLEDFHKTRKIKQNNSNSQCVSCIASSGQYAELFGLTTKSYTGCLCMHAYSYLHKHMHVCMHTNTFMHTYTFQHTPAYIHT